MFVVEIQNRVKRN